MTRKKHDTDFMLRLKDANRLIRLPPYPFTVLNRLKTEVRATGVDVIDLGMGNPDQPTPPHIVKAMHEALDDPANHRYSRPGDKADTTLREAISHYYRDRFGVKLDPMNETLPLIGSKEGVAHLSQAYLDADDIALVPSPAYPVHFNGVLLAGGILYNIPLLREHGYLPDLDSIPKEILRMAKFMFMSYPHNPTGAVADKPFIEHVVDFAMRNKIFIVYDHAYSDIVFDDLKSPSLMQVKGGRDIGIEVHTLSKSYNMAGWRVGMAVGNSRVLSGLAKTKSYVDFDMFNAIKIAAAAALTGPQKCVRDLVAMYQKRRDVFCAALAEAGWKIPVPRGTFYIWAHIPMKYSSLPSVEFAEMMVRKVGVACAPGTGFGEYGEGFVRFALVEPEERLLEAAKRIQTLLEMKV